MFPPTDFQYESRGLMAENNTIYKTIRKKTEAKNNIAKNTCAVFLLYVILKLMNHNIRNFGKSHTFPPG